MIKHYNPARLQYAFVQNPTLLSFNLDDIGGSGRQVTGKLRGNDFMVAVTHGKETRRVAIPTHLIRDFYASLTELLNEAAETPDLHEYV